MGGALDLGGALGGALVRELAAVRVLCLTSSALGMRRVSVRLARLYFSAANEFSYKKEISVHFAVFTTHHYYFLGCRYGRSCFSVIF